MTDKNDRDAEGCCTGPDAAKGSGGAESVTMPPPVPGRRQVADHAVQFRAAAPMSGPAVPKLRMMARGRPAGRVKPFLIGATSVTNAEFAAFVEATSYVTEAERWGWSFVFWTDVPKAAGPTEGVIGSEWWRRVDGATWRAIHGPGSEDACRPDHPAVHMSWNDAAAYAAWVGGRLPSEAEWEHAARGGLGDVRFPWGDEEPDDSGFFPCNIWQGRFPQANSAADGHAGTAPARCFEPNGFGLYNMVGNVWEWSADEFRIRSLKKRVRERLKTMRGFRLSKGGSFLCHRSYCYRYRIAARSGISPDSSAAHQGFRIAWDLR